MNHKQILNCLLTDTVLLFTLSNDRTEKNKKTKGD